MQYFFAAVKSVLKTAMQVRLVGWGLFHPCWLCRNAGRLSGSGVFKQVHPSNPVISTPRNLSWWPDCDSDSSSWSFPPLARETLCWWVDSWAVPYVHPVQSHERGLSLAPGNAGLQGGDRDASSQTGIQDK